MTASSKLDRGLTPQTSRLPLLWFSLGLAAVLLLSIALRFWGLGRFNTLVFDEVYFPKFASNFLKGIPLFEGHPPLSTYILAFGIWIGERFAFGNPAIQNNFTGLMLSPISYRWLNALTGSLIPLVVGGIAYQLTQRRSYALIAALFAAVDGLFLVESRYGLINVYLVIFGLLGHYFLLAALNHRRQRQIWLSLAGICLGAAFGVKWNGLGYLLGIYLLWMLAWVIEAALKWRSTAAPDTAPGFRSPLQRLTELGVGQVIVFLGILPAVTYWLSWIPFIRLDPRTNFWQWQAKIIDYHQRVGGMDAHAYCSPWHSWLFMERPIAYFYKTAHAPGEPASIVGPPLPQEASRVLYDVHAMGNPILWWLASATMLVLVGLLVGQVWLWIVDRSNSKLATAGAVALPAYTALYLWTSLYLVVNWLANWLPWAKVTRCVFIYHYMEALMFSFLGIALLVDGWMTSDDRNRRTAGSAVIFIVLLAFAFWLPMYLGLPLSPWGLKIRQWFPSWI